MSDEIDMAAAQEEAYRAAALNRRHASLPSVGQCYSCGEPLEGSLRFCDVDCRQDWDRAEKARKRGGNE